MLRLDGKVAYVTGGTGGIGWGIAQALATQGAKVVLGGRDQGRLSKAAAKLEAAYGLAAQPIVADLTDAEQVRQGFSQLFAQHRRLDVLVNNAGVLGDARLGMISDQLLDDTLAVNTRAAILHLQGAARLMQRAGAGSIINITSIIGVQGNVGQSVYAASKAALIGLTRAAAKELAAAQIRVNAVAPGYVATPMIAHLDDDTHAQRLAAIKMGRIGQPQDIAHAVLFFASDLSSYITGQVLGVDGGMEVG